MMKAMAIINRREKAMLKKVAFVENLISTSFDRLPFFAQNFGAVFDSNVKNENIGKSKREGCLRKVLNRLGCQVKTIPVIKPGRVRERRAEIEIAA